MKEIIEVMSLEVITIRLPKQMIKVLDDIVQSGLYPNRSEVIRAAILHYLKVVRDVHIPILKEVEKLKEEAEEKGIRKLNIEIGDNK